MARPKKGVTFWDRVYAHIQKNGSCLEFHGARDDCGYGRINRGGKLVRLHRAVWERDHGPIPDGMVIMHTCDNPPCINPLHLVMGTQTANIKDMWTKDRGARHFGNRHTFGKHINVGETHGLSKFTNADVVAIKKRLKDGEKVVEIAKDFKVSRAAIYHIRRGDRWKHIE